MLNNLVFSNFKKTISSAKLPFDYSLFSNKKRKLLRYSSSVYGYSFDKQSSSFCLWLTFGLKRNVSVPFSYFYNLRSNKYRKINSDSWLNYSYLVQSSLIKNYNLLNVSNNLNLNLSSSKYLSLHLADDCLAFRRLPYTFRQLRTSPLEIDLSVSSYNNQFYLRNYEARSQFFWIANNDYMLSSDFLLWSFDNPKFRDVNMYDFRRRWIPRFFVFFRNYINKVWFSYFSSHKLYTGKFSLFNSSLNILKNNYYKEFNTFLNDQIINLRGNVFLKTFLKKVIISYFYKNKKFASLRNFKKQLFYFLRHYSNSFSSKIFYIFSKLLKMKNSKFQYNNLFLIPSLNIFKYKMKNSNILRHNWLTSRWSNQSISLDNQLNYWISFTKKYSMRNTFMEAYSALTLDEKNTRGERLLLYSKFKYLYEINSLNAFFDLGYKVRTNYSRAFYKGYLAKINVHFFSTNFTANYLKQRTIYSYRDDILVWSITRWNNNYVLIDNRLGSYYGIIFLYFKNNYNHSVSDFLEYSFENMVFKFLFLSYHFFNSVYLVFVKDRKLTLKLIPYKKRSALKKSFLLLSKFKFDLLKNNTCIRK